MVVLSVRQRVLFLVGGFALFIIAMVSWPTRATAVSSPAILAPVIVSAPSAAPDQSADPMHDPFMDYYSEFADANAPTPKPAAGASGSTPALALEGVAPGRIEVCLTFGGQDKSTVPYAILEAGGRRQYVTIGDQVGGAAVTAITFDAVEMSNGTRLRRDDSHCESRGVGASPERSGHRTATEQGDNGTGARYVPQPNMTPLGFATASPVRPSPNPLVTLTPINGPGNRSSGSQSPDIYNPIDPKTPYMSPGLAPTPAPEGQLTPL